MFLIWIHCCLSALGIYLLTVNRAMQSLRRCSSAGLFSRISSHRIPLLPKQWTCRVGSATSVALSTSVAWHDSLDSNSVFAITAHRLSCCVTRCSLAALPPAFSNVLTQEDLKEQRRRGTEDASSGVRQLARSPGPSTRGRNGEDERRLHWTECDTKKSQNK